MRRRLSVEGMDDSKNKRIGTPARPSSNSDAGLGIMFAAFGVTLTMTLDTPWAGLPMIGLGLFYTGKSLRDAHRRRATAAGSTDTEPPEA